MHRPYYLTCASMQRTHYVWMVKYSNVWVVCMLRSKPDLTLCKASIASLLAPRGCVQLSASSPAVTVSCAEQRSNAGQSSMTLVLAQGPTIAPIFSSADMGLPEGHAYYAATICVPKSRLYASVKELRKVSIVPACMCHVHVGLAMHGGQTTVAGIQVVFAHCLMSTAAKLEAARLRRCSSSLCRARLCCFLHGSRHCNLQKVRVQCTDVKYVQLGGSGVLVLPMTYIFDEEPVRWSKVLESLKS